MCSTAHRSNRPNDWGDTLCSVSPAGNRCYFVLLDKDESCPTADRSNIGRTNGSAYLTGELLNMP